MFACSTKSLVAILALLSCTLAARGATWTLANGDRLTGELLREDAAVIEIQHAQLGRITVPRGALQPPAAPAARPPTPADAQGGAPSSTAVKPKVPKWKRQVDVGYAQQSGAREKQDLSVRMQVDGKAGANTFRATARLLRTDADNLIVTDRREADFRWRHDINKRLFTQALTTYTEDSVRKIDLNLEQQVGGGYRVMDSERHKANVGLGAVFQYLDRAAFEEQTALLGSFFQDYTFELNSRLKVTQDSSFTYSDTGALTSRSGVVAGAPSAGSYRLRFNTGVQSKLTEHMSLNVRFEYDYDRSIIESELRADQRLTTSLGYIW
jgi:putative salt-induced outer membrane protein YdiY